ncbi:hypothetical protein FEM33_14795 [Dyadobacter flavalbus]|uniref:Uncharacterized protein n=1 Tax=Dyadobacter flavalbus TaxID=2579942 RepID=A0A5M8QUK9_9BACT|nr:hypothetical protein [Dyadobacter flavalbus]KAA6438968.1 hypothetical protein FEM33_14795 [Dyadobacter flavalbus]
MDSIRTYLDLIYEYEPTSASYKERTKDFAGSCIALDYEQIPDAGEMIDLGSTEFHQAPDYWYTKDTKKYCATLLIWKKDWIIDFIEVTCSCMVIYLAHLTKNEIGIKLCLSNQ